MRSTSLVALMAPCSGTAAFVIPTPKVTATISRNMERGWNRSWGDTPPPYQSNMIDQRYDNEPDVSKPEFRQEIYNAMPPQDMEDNVGEGSYYYDDARPPYEGREYQQEYEYLEDFDRGSPIGEFDDRQSNRYPQNFGPQPQAQYLDESDDYFDDPQNPFEFRDGPYQQEYFDQGQSPEYGRNEDYGRNRNGYDNFEGSQQQQFDPRIVPNRDMVRQNRSNRRQQLHPFGPMQKQRPMYEPPIPMPPRMGGGMMSPVAGSGMMDRMMNEVANSFEMMDQMMYEMQNSYGMMDEMMGRMNSGMEPGMNQDLLADARDYLHSNSAIADTLGDNIEFGRPFAQSSSSALVNGVNKSRIKMGIPVRGSGGQGRAMILADEAGITELAVDVGDDHPVIEVIASDQGLYNSRESGSGDIIDVGAAVEENDD